MAEIRKKHDFTVGKKADGSTVYMIDGSEVPDKTTWANLRQKSMDVGTQTMDAVDSDANAEMKESEKSFDDIFKAKGGKINLADCKVNTAKKNSFNSRW